MPDLFNIKCSSAKEVPELMNKVQFIQKRLLTLKVTIEDQMIINAIERALPSSFGSFLDTWSMFDLDLQTSERFI